MSAIIVNEFKKSMLRSIEKFSQQIMCDEKNVQIAFELSPKNENVHKVLSGYNHFATVQLNDLLFLSPMYVMFKSKIPGVLNKCLCDLRDQHGSEFITVFVTKSVMAGEIRVMIFVKGKHVKDISIEDFIKL
jgi:hypothetical protein